LDLGPRAEGWIPFADLLARLLAEVVRRALPGPAPLLWHLPEGAPGLVVYSGDEDQAEVAWNDAEFAAVRAGGGRMNLYLIPERTQSTAADLARYRQHHDLGPHPDLRPLDGRPVAERLAEFERQVRFFEQHFGGRARTLRNHCTAWAGYLEIVEVMARLGVRMEGNYFSGGFGRFREPAPYAPFGAAMPMRFCWPSGRLATDLCPTGRTLKGLMASDAIPTEKDKLEKISDTWWQKLTSTAHRPHRRAEHRDLQDD
jgi:hypothetical protein